MQTSCKDFDQIGIQQPDACTWAELKKKLLYEKNLQVHKILKGKIFFSEYARNSLLGGEIIKWKNEKIGKISVILKIRQKKFRQKIGVRAPQRHPPI